MKRHLRSFYYQLDNLIHNSCPPTLLPHYHFAMVFIASTPGKAVISLRRLIMGRDQEIVGKQVWHN